MKNSKEKDIRYTGKSEFWGFAVGAMGQGMIYAMMSSYISDYYVNILQLPLIFVLLLMLLARVWDAINDPLMGVIVDSRTSPRGKMKPYIIYAALPIAILTVLMYFNPHLESKSKMMVYAAVVYILWGMIYTMADVPFWSLPNVMTPSAKERGSVISIGRTLNGVGSAVPEVLFLVCGFVLPLLLDTSNPAAYNEKKYLIIAVIAVVLGGLLYIGSYFVVKERVIIPEAPKKKGESRLKRIFTCRPLMLVMTMGVLSSGRYMVQAAALHVARYAFYIGPELTDAMTIAERTAFIDKSVSSVKTIFNVCAIVGMFGAMLFMPALMKKFDYKKIVITTCILGFISSIFTTLIGWFTQQLYVCIPFIIISCIPLGVLNVISYAMIGDCLDYMELKTGFRDNALGSACQGFVNKLGNALATSAIILVYLFIGLKPENMLNSEVIMAATDLAANQRFAMFSLVSIVPGISLLLCAIPMFFYHISGKEKSKMLEELAEKRQKSNIVIE